MCGGESVLPVLLLCHLGSSLELSLTLPFFEIGMKTDLFQSCGHCWVFQIFWHIECNTFIASCLRIWNSSTGIPSPPLALFVVMLSKARLTSHPYGLEFEWTPWVGDGQGGLACCNSWGCKDSDMTDDWTELNWLHIPGCLAVGEWSLHCDYLGREALFCTVLLCILATSS